MTVKQFEVFDEFRTDFKSFCYKLNCEYGEILPGLQKVAAMKDTPEYSLETPVVYNSALDEISLESDIRLIVIGDNPGKDEQLKKNLKYLVGQSGKIAAGFFAKNPEFNVDFRKNAVILNKTPVHTAKTNHIKFLLKNGGSEVKNLISESQVFMAQRTSKLHMDLCAAAGSDGIQPELWLVGYAELKGKGLFLEYRDELYEFYKKNPELWNKVFVFQHFSMNRFLIDLKDFRTVNPDLTLVEAVYMLGKAHKSEIFENA